MARAPGRAYNDSVTRAFDRLARRYDTPWIQSWFYRPPQDAIVDELRRYGSRRVVDVGCGTGILADRIQRELRPDEVIGVDASEGMLAKAKERSTAVRWILGAAETLPLPDDALDAVTSTTAFHFFDQSAALAEFHRVLAPGGIVALGTITQPLPAPAPIRRIFGRWRTPQHHPSAAELRNLLAEAGFARIEQHKLQSWAGRWLLFYRVTVGVKSPS
jgi:ubiquinone/menaquinone biosynthesis C-methylase UbiE